MGDKEKAKNKAKYIKYRKRERKDERLQIYKSTASCPVRHDPGLGCLRHNESPWPVVGRRNGSVWCVAVVGTAAVGVWKSDRVSVLRSSLPFLCELRGLPFGEAFWKWTNLRRQSPDDPLGQRLDPARRRLLLPGKLLKSPTFFYFVISFLKNLYFQFSIKYYPPK